MATLTQQAYILVEASNRIMATDVSIHLAVPPAQEKVARVAIQAGMNWMYEVDRRLTRFDMESELSQLNDAAGRWQPTSAMLFTVVREAVAAAAKSDGLFDPTLLPQLEALGYDRDFSLLNRQANDLAESASSASEASWRGIEFDAPHRRMRLPVGTHLDLGGIAKGWAADVALKRFFQPFDNVIVNVGGDLRMRGGPQPGEHWAVGIRDPRTDHLSTGDNIAIVRMGRGGLATSGASRRWWYQGGQRQHHLLDPRTGRPAAIWMPQSAGDVEGIEDADAAHLIATATALAPTAAQAEVAAKVALLRGYPDALEAVDAAWEAGRTNQTEGMALLLVMGDGHIVLSSNINEYLAICGAGGIIWG